MVVVLKCSVELAGRWMTPERRSLSVARTVTQDSSARELSTGFRVWKLCREAGTYRAVERRNTIFSKGILFDQSSSGCYIYRMD